MLLLEFLTSSLCLGQHWFWSGCVFSPMHNFSIRNELEKRN
ncbi:hypothetical protein M758_5G174200 [Ceratodon purpureus]|nr:hypothetical protein M758_5G174200 [Ceratodon purpureus]